MPQKFEPRPHNSKLSKKQVKAALIAAGHKNVAYSGNTQYDKDGNVVRGPGIYFE